MNDHKCSECGALPGRGSVVRLVGRDRTGVVVELCVRCYLATQKRGDR